MEKILAQRITEHAEMVRGFQESLEPNANENLMSILSSSIAEIDEEINNNNMRLSADVDTSTPLKSNQSPKA